ncbi:MAG: glycosyltransferase family 2 protein [Devosia sp.]
MTDFSDPSLVTIVIPAFNAERFLASTLRSATAQTHANLQIIVVDDGSTDGTADLVRQHAELDPRIELFSKANAGLSAARNDGLRLSRGEFVTFLDADDLWHPDKIRQQLRAVNNHGCPERVGAVYTLSRQIDEADRLLMDYPTLTVQGAVLRRLLLTNFIATGGSNLLCPREVALEVGGFDISYQPPGAGTSEDYDFQLKVAARYDILAMEQYLVGYRRYPGSMSRNQLRMARSRRSVIEHHLEVNGIGGRCRRWALGGVDVVECGAYLAWGKPVAALGAVWRLALGDPRRLIWEVFVRLPLALAARLDRRRKAPGPAFADLDPTQANPARAPGLLLARLQALEAEDAS